VYIPFISDEKCHGLVSNISSKCGGCGEVIPFSTSPQHHFPITGAMTVIEFLNIVGTPRILNGD